MRDSIHALRELGYQTSGLFPFSYEWYRRYGWEFVSHYLIYTVKPNYLPPYSETQFVRPYEERDLPALMTIYTDRYSNHVGPFVRIEQEWKENIFRRFGEVMVYDGGGVKGYLIGRTKEEDGRHFEIKEIVATSEEARRGLVGWLARLDPELKPIKFLTSEFELRDLELFTPRADWLETYESRCNIRLRPGLMFRIIDLLTAMKRLAQRMSGIPMGLAIHALDELAPWNDDPVLIEGTKMPSVRKGESPFWIKADIRVISQLYIGYMSPREAFSLGKIEVSGPEAVELAEQVFRKSEPFIPEVNEF